MAGLARALRAEWTKLRSVRSTAACLLLGIGLTVGLSTLLAAAGKTDDGPHRTDEFSFVHQPVTGNASITARVAAQGDTHEWAKAGILVKARLESGSPYAAMMVTPEHGVRMQSEFATDIAGSTPAAPVWLRLTRTGPTVVGEESSDGVTWRRVGSVELAGLPATVEIGLFVTSPFRSRVVQGGGRDSVEMVRTDGRATFDQVAVEPVGPDATWHRDDVTTAADRSGNRFSPGYGQMTENGGVYTVTGAGDIVGPGIPGFSPGGRDTVSDSLQGVQIGLMALAALGVVFAAAEYRTGLVRTTLAAVPARGRVLAAKAAVVGAAAFLAGLVASLTAFLIAQALLRERGLRPPVYPHLSITDGPVLRAVLGSALALAVFAVLGLAVATLLRRAAVSIALVIGLVHVPQILGAAAIVSLDAELWLNRVTPAAGLAILQSRVGAHSAIDPWTGLGVLGLWTGLALVLAYGRLRWSDA
jgi:ABC-2 family transporter protein